MKYEPVFGDDDFSGQSNELAEVKLWHDSLGPNFVSMEELHCMSAGGLIPRGSVILAMRRIIAEPKRWTVEDQRAGRLPDVGSIGLTNYGRAEYLGNDSTSIDKCHVRYEDGYCERIAIEKFTPLETPKEKAQRLRSEWINKAYVDFHRLGCELEVLQKEQIKQIYDALLSGELTMPNKDGE